jgi:hypothetical protein
MKKYISGGPTTVISFQVSAPFSTAYSGRSFHNAVIFAADQPEGETEGGAFQDIQVRVIFSHPTETGLRSKGQTKQKKGFGVLKIVSKNCLGGLSLPFLSPSGTRMILIILIYLHF